MGIWRSAGGFPVVKRQKEMRAQRPLNARQPANGHRRVLAVSAFLILILYNIYLLFVVTTKLQLENRKLQTFQL